MEVTSAAKLKRHGRKAILVILAQLMEPFVKNGPPPGGSGRILLIRPDHLGDVLFTTPAVRRLRTSRPEAHISYLAGPWAAPIVERNPHVDEILFHTFSWFDGRASDPFWAPYSQLTSLARQLRSRRFDAAVNLRYDFWWGAALIYLARIPYRVGYAVGDCRSFHHPAIPYLPGRHEVTQNIALIEPLIGTTNPLGRAEDCGGLEFPIAAEEHGFAEQYLSAHGIGAATPLLVIHPGTRAPIKRWPASNFAHLATVLARRIKGKVLLTGNGDEGGLTAAIAAQCDVPAVDAAGKTTLGQLAALFARAKLVVGVDSGPLHLAAGIGCPTVHLYGPTDHLAFAPFGDLAMHAVVRAGIECSPCHRLDWPEAALANHDCMALITVEQVLRAAEQVLAAAQAIAS